MPLYASDAIPNLDLLFYLFVIENMLSSLGSVMTLPLYASDAIPNLDLLFYLFVIENTITVLCNSKFGFIILNLLLIESTI